MILFKTLQDLARLHRDHFKIAAVLDLQEVMVKPPPKNSLMQYYRASMKPFAPKEILIITLSTLYLAETSVNPRDRNYRDMPIIKVRSPSSVELSILTKLIINFGKAHLEGFGGIEGVVKGKSELYQHLIHVGGVIFFNEEDSIQIEKLTTYDNRSSYGLVEEADTYLELSTAPTLTLKWENLELSSSFGKYNV